MKQPIDNQTEKAADDSRQQLVLRLRNHLAMCAPHQMDRLGVKLLVEATDKIEEQQKMIKSLCEDWAESHTHAQNVAKRVGVPEAKVEGDSYGVPCIEELVDMIAQKFETGLPGFTG